MHFLTLYMNLTILFQLNFIFIYNTLNNNFFSFKKLNSLLNMKTVLQVTSVPIRSLFVFSVQLLPVFTCCLQSVCRACLPISTSLLRYFLGDSKARTPTSSLWTHTELDYRNYLSFSFDG